MNKGIFKLNKMKTVFDAHLSKPVQYFLYNNKNEQLHINELLNKNVSLSHTGKYFCTECDKEVKKLFGQGFCYTCFTNSAENSPCIIHPELCRGHLGEGRDLQWELNHHVQPHLVYIAKSSGMKIGVTRSLQIPTRWIDQGADEAIIFAKTENRYQAGVIEVYFKQFLSDKTNWQKMLKNIKSEEDLLEIKNDLKNKFRLHELYHCLQEESSPVKITYPHANQYDKIISNSLEKTSKIEGKLTGIKGQYLIFDGGKVINIRNHTGFEVQIESTEDELQFENNGQTSLNF
jgi:hypothetical protein